VRDYKKIDDEDTEELEHPLLGERKNTTLLKIEESEGTEPRRTNPLSSIYPLHKDTETSSIQSQSKQPLNYSSSRLPPLSPQMSANPRSRANLKRVFS
jgi:hypothetical protein